MRLFTFILSLLILSTPAFAEVEQCGVPDEAELSTTPNTAFCDIYQRQLAYRIEANKFREKINDRNEAFAAPRRAAYEQYQADLKALEGERTFNGYRSR
jgi:hypothetical protein